MKYFYTFFFIIIFQFNSFSKCITIGGGGKWWTPATWSCSPEFAPSGCADTIVISAGDSVYVDATVDLIACGPIVVVVEGILYFKSGSRLKLADGSKLFIQPGAKIAAAGGGNSSYLEIGAVSVWQASDGPQSGPLTFTAAGILPGALPVKLVSFEALLNDDKIDIKWITSAEINNDFFTIEKSQDLKKWETVIVTNGAGNSSVNIEYFEVDYSPFNGVSYYRLKQTDYNGSFEYFNIVPVKVDLLNNLVVSLFPNPINRGEDLKIKISEIKNEVLIVIRDAKGDEFYSKAILGYEDNSLIVIPILKEIPSGVYLVTASSDNQIYNQKVIIK